MTFMLSTRDQGSANPLAGNLTCTPASRVRRLISSGLIVASLVCAANALAAVGDITVVAGNGTAGHTGDGGPATAARIGASGLALDAAGNIYMTSLSSQTVRKVDAATQTISTIAGQIGVASPWGYTGGDGVPATQTTFFNPAGIAVDHYGDVYVGELQGGRLRRIDHWTGLISTVAGTGVFGNTQEGAIANQTPLFYVPAVTLGVRGDLFITDIGRMGVWKVGAATRTINAVALDPEVFSFPQRIAVDSADNVYVATLGPDRILRVTPQGATQTLVSSDAEIRGIALDGANHVFYTVATRNTVSRRDAVTGVVTTVATIPGVSGLGDIEPDGKGNLFVVGGNRIHKIEGVAVPQGGGGDCLP